MDKIWELLGTLGIWIVGMIVNKQVKDTKAKQEYLAYLKKIEQGLGVSARLNQDDRDQVADLDNQSGKKK